MGLLMLKVASDRWVEKCINSLVFVISSTFVLSLIRIFFFYHYKSPDLVWSDFYPALIMGMRVDAKWLLIFIAAAWVLLLLSYWRPSFWMYTIAIGVVGQAIMVGLSLGNYEFYGFYGTPFSSLVFGLFQDDTEAILVTLWKDWPIFSYLIAWVLLTIIPIIVVLSVRKIISSVASFGVGCVWKKDSLFIYIIIALIGTISVVGVIRGSLGKFPLRQQDFSVSTNAFINATVPGGAAAFYEAWKGQNAIKFNGGSQMALVEMGFKNKGEAEAAISKIRITGSVIEEKRHSAEHVVVVIMESMGRDIFETQNLPKNDVLGELANQLDRAVVFRNGVSINNGTFPSLEGILFDTSISPLTQSRYGKKRFPFSNYLPFKEAGYKMVFLTSGSEAWRMINDNFPIQGFDEIVGSTALSKEFLEAEVGTWGIGDKWMFDKAVDILKEADEKREKICLVILSTTNHPPFKVPDGILVNPVDPNLLPSFVKDERSKCIPSFETYQYAANALGVFVKSIYSEGFSNNTVVVATGDHNTRLQYDSMEYLPHMRGVPLLFWLPDSWDDVRAKADTTRWVSHRDIFPSILGMVLGVPPKIHEGRDLFSNETFDLALSFTTFGDKGFAIGSWGAVGLNNGGQVTCMRWNGDRLDLLDVCTGEFKLMADAARAQRALSDYQVREGVLAAPK